MLSRTIKSHLTSIGKALGWATAAMAVFYVGTALGVDGQVEPGSLADVSKRVTGSFSSVAKLITAGAYVAGMGFAVGAVMKFKAHKDNPTQIPVGTPIALLFIATALIFLPEVFRTAGVTLFGEKTVVAGPDGTDLIPGLNNDGSGN